MNRVHVAILVATSLVVGFVAGRYQWPATAAEAACRWTTERGSLFVTPSTEGCSDSRYPLS